MMWACTPGTFCRLTRIRDVERKVLNSDEILFKNYRVAHEMSYHFIIPLKLQHRSNDVANVRVNAVVHGKCDRCHQFVK